MPKKSRRKFFTRRKSHVTKKNCPAEKQETPDGNPTQNVQAKISPAPKLSPANIRLEPLQPCPTPLKSPTLALVNTALQKLRCCLPVEWLSTADSKGFYIMLISSQDIKAIQRQVSISFLGEANAFVHSKPCSRLNEVFRFIHSPIRFNQESLDRYCESVSGLVEVISQYTICVGVNHLEPSKILSSVPNAYVDTNPYLEESYKTTLRSKSCSQVVSFESDDVRCEQCKDILAVL